MIDLESLYLNFLEENPGSTISFERWKRKVWDPKFSPTIKKKGEIPFLVDHKTFGDQRGNFCGAPLSMPHDERLDKAWVQVNTSISIEPFTIRGLHYQVPPFEQSKYLKVIHGRIKSMILCVDESRGDFGSTHTFEVDKDHAVMVPRGFANGLITLEPNTVIQYFVDSLYSIENERSIRYSSVSQFRAIVEEITKDPIISEKDLNGLDFTEDRIFYC